MAFELLSDTEKDCAVFFCNTNMRAFGPVRSVAPMRQIEDIAGALGLDLRTLPPHAIDDIIKLINEADLLDNSENASAALLERIAEMVADIEASNETKEREEQ